jgi:hypothetical protein
VVGQNRGIAHLPSSMDVVKGDYRIISYHA